MEHNSSSRSRNADGTMVLLRKEKPRKELERQFLPREVLAFLVVLSLLIAGLAILQHI